MRRLSKHFVFDHALKKRQWEWAGGRDTNNDYDYLRQLSASRLVERLDDITRDFEFALDFGCHKGHILDELNKQNEAFISAEALVVHSELQKIVFLIYKFFNSLF